VSALGPYTRQVRPPLIGTASLPKRALSASATCPAGTAGIDAVVLGILGAGWVCAGGVAGIERLLGPKISLRVAGTGEIRPVDGVAENNEFWAKAACGATTNAANTRAGHSRPHEAAVADALVMTRMFSAEIEAISSQEG
jgi:hypothetical protein